MRKLSLIFSFLLAIALAGMTLIYLEDRVGQNRIYVQEHWFSAPEGQAYRGYGALENTNADTVGITAAVDSVPPALPR